MLCSVLVWNTDPKHEAWNYLQKENWIHTRIHHWKRWLYQMISVVCNVLWPHLRVIYVQPMGNWGIWSFPHSWLVGLFDFVCVHVYHNEVGHMAVFGLKYCNFKWIYWKIMLQNRCYMLYICLFSGSWESPVVISSERCVFLLYFGDFNWF